MGSYPYFNSFQQLPAYPYPQYQQAPQQPQQSSGIIWVGSDQEATAHLVMPNTAVALWNSNAPVVYLKQADASGKPTMRIYDLVERTQSVPTASAEPVVKFATQDDLNALAARVDELASKSAKVEKGEKK